MELTAAPELRTSIVATPGITLGVRMVTNSLYGPAFTCSYTSLLPICACAGRASTRERSKVKTSGRRELHRCTPRIQRPKSSPSHAEMEA